MEATFDLFADDPAIVPPAPAPAPRTPDPERLAYQLTPIGVNRWTYKGEILLYDSHKLTVPGRSRWSSLEGIGKPEIRGDSHVEVCRGIDARQGAAS